MVKQQVKSVVISSILAGMSLPSFASALDLSNDDELSVIGSVKAGNPEGTIPAYSGKAPKTPANFREDFSNGRPNPYDDEPLFSITAENASQYAEQLDGMIEIFEKYPDFRMDIYPTHRDVSYPEYVIENTQKNLTECKEIAGGVSLEGCYAGIPFPVPETGTQAMWNHLLQFTAYEYKTIDGWDAWVTTPDGKAVLQTRAAGYQRVKFFDPEAQGPHDSSLIYIKIRQEDLAPARKVGGVLVLHSSVDAVNVGTRIWQYVPGQRRVKLAPNLAYDTPSPNSGGTSTIDDSKGFMGPLDRYDFTLAGKEEKFIMYNNFALNNPNDCGEEKIVNHANFPNPDCIRWELHRVWKVEATLKDGYRHAYPKRVFYWDEDAPGAGSVENYDSSGSLYRVANNIAIPFYEGEKGGMVADGTIYMDLQTGMWSVQALLGRAGAGWTVVEEPLSDILFNPEGMAGSGFR